ncbi:MAG: hypothetical protein EZS28_051552, partial [Streblomastix strix]
MDMFCVVGSIFRRAFRLSPDSNQQIGQGKVINMVSTDAQRLENTQDQLQNLIDLPVNLIIASFTLSLYLDASALIGIVVLLILSPLSFLFSKSTMKVQKELMQITDRRVKRTTEAIHSIKV